jgi:hypothetical protein
MLPSVGGRGTAGAYLDGAWIGRQMILSKGLDSGNQGLVRLKSQLQVAQARSAAEQMAGKNEELLGTSGGNLVYAGYPYDPFA